MRASCCGDGGADGGKALKPCRMGRTRSKQQPVPGRPLADQLIIRAAQCITQHTVRTQLAREQILLLFAG